MREAIDWIAANEPETLEFSLYEEHNSSSDGNAAVRLFMVERFVTPFNHQLQFCRDCH